MKHYNVRELETQHRTLELQIHKLERRGMHMTPVDERRATELKKQRLVTKDRIAELRRS